MEIHVTAESITLVIDVSLLNHVSRKLSQAFFSIGLKIKFKRVKKDIEYLSLIRN
jgi:hypothetical protein